MATLKPEEKKKIPGVEVELAGESYILPPLTLGQLRGGALELIRQNDEMLDKGQWLEALSIKSKVVAIALRRNYPHLSDEDVEEMLDLRNWDKVWEVIMGGSGLRSQANREAFDKGELTPPPPPTQPNGVSSPSTTSSLEPTAGDTKTSMN